MTGAGVMMAALSAIISCWSSIVSASSSAWSTNSLRRDIGIPNSTHPLMWVISSLHFSAVSLFMSGSLGVSRANLARKATIKFCLDILLFWMCYCPSITPLTTRDSRENLIWRPASGIRELHYSEHSTPGNNICTCSKYNYTAF